MASGCYYYPPDAHLYGSLPIYLPQLKLDVHATILSTSSRTVITQTFTNVSTTDPVYELFYIFPLYESSSVAAFTSTIDGKTVRGIVKPKTKAEEVYEKAKAEGKTAAIFDQSTEAADVFKIRIGNLPAGEQVHIQLTLVAELKQDTQTNGSRYTFPLTIAPRYGAADYDYDTVIHKSLCRTSLRVDINMEKGSDIREIRSPSHPIAVTLGRTSSMAENSLDSRYASVKLRENDFSAGDFILTINATNQDCPCAFLEKHPILPDQRALMLSLVPKFTIPSSDSEIIFVIDRSGSMQDKIPTLRSALEVFLKSIPIGVNLNIVSFGTRISYLWPHSKPCSRKSLEQALNLSRDVEADHGGTDILLSLKAAVDKRRNDKLLDVLLLTDGQIWNQAQCINFVKESNKNLSARFFTLGIGNEVSHSLIEGISRAGAGFSQTVLNYEELDKKVILMLKGALMGRLSNIRLDMDLPDMMDEDFTEIEGSRSSTATPIQPATISLFNEECTGTEQIEELHPLPKIVAPDFIQAPNELPPLYPFVRSTAYVLLSKHIDTFPEKITLRANSSSGPLELEIPVQDMGVGETIHKLAAKKATTELEEGSGWVYTAKDTEGNLIPAKCPARIDELIQNECERLGGLFQVAGKYCSIVAVHEDNDDIEYVPNVPNVPNSEAIPHQRTQVFSARSSIAYRPPMHPSRGGRPGRGGSRGIHAQGSLSRLVSRSAASGGDVSRYMDDRVTPYHQYQQVHYAPESPQSNSLCLLQNMPSKTGGRKASVGHALRRSVSVPRTEPAELSKLQKIIHLQEYEGYWKWTEDILQKVGLDAKRVQRDLDKQYKKLTGDSRSTRKRSRLTSILATILVGRYFEREMAESKDVWELVKEKADIWIQNATQGLKEDEQILLNQLIDGVLAPR